MISGYVDGLFEHHVGGWAFNASQPDEHLKIEISYQGKFVASGVASNFRDDLPGAGIGAGDHGFFIPVPPELTSLSNLVIIARSIAHGDLQLEVATDVDRMTHELFDAVTARYDQALGRLTSECDRLRERLDGLRLPSSPAPALPQDIDSRLAALESRMEAAEVFFVRIDETVRRLSEESKKRRRRFLGIF